MKKRKKVALYDPYLDVMGGGERHVLSILQVLQKHEYDPVVFWDKNLNSQIKKQLDIPFDPPLEFEKNIFTADDETSFSRTRKLKGYDMLIYVTDGSYFFSTAKKNFVFCMVPQKSLYEMTLGNIFKVLNFKWLSNSEYTHKWLKSWGIPTKVIYPYISDVYFDNYSTKKKKIILSVGRFFKHLHSKRQDVAIKWFQELQKKGKLTDYKLVLAGNVKKEDKGYLDELKQLAGSNKNIQFKTNISSSDLLGLYKKAEYYWHFAGFDVNEQEHPERVEHLGITPLEAMASGCIVFGYNAGGVKEIISNGENGYLFKTQDELFTTINALSETDKDTIRSQAHEFVKKQFSYDAFEDRVVSVLL